MSLRTARLLFAAFFAVYTVVLTFPGAVPFSRIRPLVLGLPFSLFWVLLWVALGFVVFFAVDRVEAAAGTDAED